MLDPAMNDCGGAEGGVFGEATHSLHSHAEHAGGADGGYGTEGVVELESEEEPEEEPSHSHNPFPPLSNTHHEGHDSSHEVSHECQDSSLHLPPLAPEQHEHPDDELRHGGGPHEHETHGSGGGAAEAVLHQSAGGGGAVDDGIDGDGLHDGNGGEAVDEGGSGGGAGGMHEDEHLHFAPASPHSHGVSVVASVDSPLQRDRFC
jgi:hypothetical protein